MCGIVASNFPMPLLEDFRQIDHRGVRSSFLRDSGFTCYFRRLPTFDPDPLADAPISDASGRYVVAMNGNIYNFKELRDKYLKNYKIDRPDSDAEVLANLFHRFDIDIFLKHLLDGDFAILVYDRLEDTMVVAVDYLSFVPMYYTVTEEGIVFASECKVLRSMFRRDINPDYVKEVEIFGSPVTNITPFKEIYKIPPGSYILTQKNNKKKFNTYDYYRPTYIPRELSPDTLWDLLCESVKLRMNSCLPVIVPISGGLDSTAILAAIRHVAPKKKIKTFSIAFPGYSEFEDARLAADYFGAAEHFQVDVNPELVDGELEKIAWHYESWADRGGLIPEWFVCRTIHEMGKNFTVIKGDCPDELFGGYKRAEDSCAAGVFMSASNAGYQTIVDNSNIEKEYNKYHGNNISARTADLFMSVEKELPYYGFVKQDRCARAFTLDPRNPWYTRKIVEFAYGLGSGDCFNHGQRKYFLRRMLKGKIPDKLLNKPKTPFKYPGWEDLNLKKAWCKAFNYGYPNIFDYQDSNKVRRWLAK